MARLYAGSVADEGNAGEALLEAELPLGVGTHRHPVELLLVALHLLDEVDEVTGLLELLEVLGINHVAKLVLNANHKLNNVEGVEAMGAELRVESDGGLASRAEVVLSDGHYILLNLVVALKHEGIVGSFSLTLPEINCTILLTAILGAKHKRIVVNAKILEVSHALRSQQHSGSTHSSECCESESAQHFFF